MSVTTPALRVCLPYGETFRMTEAAASVGAYKTFSLNSLYDPNFTGTGVQPLGFDQYAQLYTRYRVHSVRIEVSFANITSASQPLNVGFYCSAQSTLPGTTYSWYLLPGAKFCQLSPMTGGRDTVTLSAKVNPWSVLGITRSEYLDDMDFSGAMTSNPVRMPFLQIWVRGEAVAGTGEITVRLWYDAELSQPVALVMS